MSTLVVDASVAAKWFLPEAGSREASALLHSAHRLIAPDLLWIEVAAVAWKAARRGGLSADEARQIAADCATFPVEIFESLPLLPRAVAIAAAADRTVYDCVYVALAERERARMITADARLVNALSAKGLGKWIRQLNT
ncbi:MAG: type II toxin-antitoxin system VapC family toxin [Phycisphaerales bacterium]|nr:type II toxin-antitoxin system VapC family toxin [Phycisphaerales bacterium]